jgi:hypothetical protein
MASVESAPRSRKNSIKLAAPLDKGMIETGRQIGRKFQERRSE